MSAATRKKAQAPRSVPLRRVAFLGNYLPRQCGIATFTTDLCEACAAAHPQTDCMALPVNDVESGYDYPARVRFEIAEKDIDSYRRAADYLNINKVDLLCLQFEYGIFGGRAGSHILAALRELRMPVVTTLHTVLEHPDTEQRRVLEEVAALSDRVVVMSRRGVQYLRDVYQVPKAKIDMIPHGIPDLPFAGSSRDKALFGVEGKTVLMSFGLLSPNKGIETVIAALPAVLARHPEAVYIVLGATHPHVKRQEGENYRLRLQRLAEQLGVAGQVIFYDRFVDMEELLRFLGATDIYITPYLNAAQITSGTLAYTVGMGKAVISTPYSYAEELLADGRGALFPFRDSATLAAQVNRLLDHEEESNEMRQRAYQFGRSMTWPVVARAYRSSFVRARAERRLHLAPEFAVKPLDQRPGNLPPLRLDHLRLMTDGTGILQHALFTVPNYREGYTLDDNARGLIVSSLLEEVGNQEAPAMSSRYLAFVWHAYDQPAGRFRNFMDYQRAWLDAVGSDDSHGRALWALGTVLGRSNTPALCSTAGQLFAMALPAILATSSPRAWAFALIGIHEYLARFDGDSRAGKVREELAGRLQRLYQAHHDSSWSWFENSLTYCNASLPHALLLCGESMPSPALTAIGFESLQWLSGVQRAGAPASHFVPIGSNGFHARNGARARFDQQPVEAQATISACLLAFRQTGDPRWRKDAHRAFDWFLGRNDLDRPIYDPTTGGCRDGLHSDRPNENQGAESTLAFLQSLLELRLAEPPLLWQKSPRASSSSPPLPTSSRESAPLRA